VSVGDGGHGSRRPSARWTSFPAQGFELTWCSMMEPGGKIRRICLARVVLPEHEAPLPSVTITAHTKSPEHPSVSFHPRFETHDGSRFRRNSSVGASLDGEQPGDGKAVVKSGNREVGEGGGLLGYVRGGVVEFAGSAPSSPNAEQHDPPVRGAHGGS